MNIKTYESFINEANDVNVNEADMNDPILVSLRAAKIEREKNKKAWEERMKKRVYGKDKEKLESELETVNDDLQDAYGERADIFDEQEAEAGEKGDDWSDADANKYGDRLNKIDAKIEKLIKRRNEIETRLLY